MKKDLTVILNKVFHHKAFRQYQKEIAECLIGGKDVLAILPTGFGKSLCYQLPAIVLDGVTIVISPLIALMKDQVKNLKELGISAAYINSDLKDHQFKKAYERASEGQYKIIYVSPERLETKEFLDLSQKIKISLLIIDEAHCVLEWGKSFRPSYLNISKYINKLPQKPTIGAFTATLPQNNINDLVNRLYLTSPKIINGYEVRDNISLKVNFLNVKNRNDYIIDYLYKNTDKKGIIYCLTRKVVDDLYEFLQSNHFKCTKYHAGMDATDKQINLDKFYNDYNIMIATKAFGMGVDIPNVDFVINNGMPDSIESYVQQVGRAGRNGKNAQAILLYDSNDYKLNMDLIIDSAMHRLTSYTDKMKLIHEEKEKLDDMLQYCKTTDNKRLYLKNIFEE